MVPIARSAASEAIVKVKRSYTGQFPAPVLARRHRRRE
jgi:hypothetical protein